MAKILKNTTGSAIVLSSIGLEIPASGQITVNVQDYILLASDDSITEITTHINAGDIVVNDGVDDITVANGFDLARAIDYLRYTDRAFYERFEAEPERSNGFSSKNVQEAIEEARISTIGTLLQYIFISNGNTSNKWLGYSEGGSAPSNDVPLIIPQDSTIKGVTFSNKDNNVDIDIEIYINGTLEYTWEVRNKRVAWEVGALNISVMQTDRVSVFVRKFTGGTGDQTAQDPIITLLGKFISEGPASGGIQTGL